MKRALLIVVGGLALVCGVMTWIAWPYVMAEPGPARAVEALDRLNAMTLEGQPEGENGWDELRRFFRDECEITGQRERGNERWVALKTQYDMEALRGSTWDDPRLDELKGQLETWLWVLPAMDRAAAAPRFAIPFRIDGDSLTDEADETEGVVSPMRSGLGLLRPIFAVNLSEMRAAAERGDFDESARRCKASIALSERVMRHPAMFDWMFGLADHGSALQELCYSLNEHDWPASRCEELISAISEGVSWRNRFEAIPAGEMAATWTFVGPMFSESGVFLMWKYDRMRGDMEGFFSGGSGKAPGDPPSLMERLGNLRAIAAPRREELAESWKQAKVECAKAMRGEPFRDGESVFGEGFALPESVRDLIFLDPGTFRGLGGQLQRVEAHAAAAQVMLRLEMFHAETGGWPQALTEAMTQEQATDPVSGSLFEYRLTPDEARPYAMRFPEDATYVSKPREGDRYDPFDVNQVRPRVLLVSEYEAAEHGGAPPAPAPE